MKGMIIVACIHLALSAMFGVTILYIAWQHNPQGEFYRYNDQSGIVYDIDYGYSADLFFRAILIAFVPLQILLWGTYVVVRSSKKLLRGSSLHERQEQPRANSQDDN